MRAVEVGSWGSGEDGEGGSVVDGIVGVIELATSVMV